MIKEKQAVFFQKLTDRSGSYDEESVKRVYFGMIKLITDGLRAGYPVELPFLGTFSVRQRSGTLKGIVNPSGILKKPTREIKFEPFYAFKAYVKKMFIRGD